MHESILGQLTLSMFAPFCARVGPMVAGVLHVHVPPEFVPTVNFASSEIDPTAMHVVVLGQFKPPKEKDGAIDCIDDHVQTPPEKVALAITVALRLLSSPAATHNVALGQLRP
jgi:hypothetical protein